VGDIAFQGQYSIVEIKREDAESKSLTAIVDNHIASDLMAAGKETEIHAFWNSANMLLLPRNAKP